MCGFISMCENASIRNSRSHTADLDSKAAVISTQSEGFTIDFQAVRKNVPELGARTYDN